MATDSKEVKAADEKLSFTKKEMESLIEKASAGAVKAAIEALQPKKVEAPEKAKDAMAGLTEKEQEEFLASFGAGKCTICGQGAVKGRYACKGKHVMMCVYPKDEYWGKFFQGVWVNGARYLSDGPGHLVAVPEDNNIEHEIQKWVDMERDNAQGRKRSFNSGSIGANGQRTT